jgi:hypothetical protein
MEKFNMMVQTQQYFEDNDFLMKNLTYLLSAANIVTGMIETAAMKIAQEFVESCGLSATRFFKEVK